MGRHRAKTGEVGHPGAVRPGKTATPGKGYLTMSSKHKASAAHPSGRNKLTSVTHHQEPCRQRYSRPSQAALLESAAGKSAKPSTAPYWSLGTQASEGTHRLTPTLTISSTR